jgi:hypothetical protein
MPGRDNRWEGKLAIALYDLQAAHGRLEALDPADRQYDAFLQEVSAALDAYRKIIGQIQASRLRTTKLSDEPT